MEEEDWEDVVVFVCWREGAGGWVVEGWEVGWAALEGWFDEVRVVAAKGR